jgi:hypothetical protein
MDNVTALIEKASWHAHAVGARYSSGIWLGLSPRPGLLIKLLDLDESADMESAGLSEYLLNAGSWLPIAHGSTLQEAARELEAKVAGLTAEQLAYGSAWSDAVAAAYQAVLDASDGGYGIAMAIDSGCLPSGPAI